MKKKEIFSLVKAYRAKSFKIMCNNDVSDDCLDEEIELLEITLSQISDDYFRNSMQSRPSYVSFYEELAENYFEGSKCCLDYAEHHDIVKFVKEMLKLGFCFEILRLKNKIKNPEALKLIEEMEEEYESDIVFSESDCLMNVSDFESSQSDSSKQVKSE